MTLEKFIESNEVDYSRNLVCIDSISMYENKIGVTFGHDLKNYIAKYGYLAFEDIEFYGINSKQGFDSDMVKQSLYLHKYFNKTVGFVAFENQGEGHYILIGSDDTVYEYVSSADDLIFTNRKLFDYVLDRFQQNEK